MGEARGTLVADVLTACFVCGRDTDSDVCPTCGAPLEARQRPELDPRDALVAQTALAAGRYSLAGLLGRGGFGITYHGTDLRLQRRVALKEFFPVGSGRRDSVVVPPSTMLPSEFRSAIQRFQWEAQVLARFSHPSIVAVHDVFEDNDTAYVVMEFLEGRTLARELEQRLGHRGQPFQECELVQLAQTLASALDQLHGKGILHLDVKPDNIMCVDANAAGESPAGRAVLIDFGAAWEVLGSLSGQGSIVVTPGYSPLEQYGKQTRRGAYTDVYALAATLYHLATGVQPPAATDRAAGVLLKPPSHLNPGLTDAFDLALAHALEMRIENRTRTAGDLWSELAGPTARSSGAQRGAAAALSPPAASPSGTGQPRAARLARAAALLSGGGPVPSAASELGEVMRCPVCRSGRVLDPAKDSGPITCPVCRRGEIHARIRTELLDCCPACQTGRLEPVAPARSAGLSGGPLHRLAELMDRAERRRRDHQGQRLRCASCTAEFVDAADTREWTSVAGDASLVPAEHRGARRVRRDWAKVLLGLGSVDGTHACDACGAEYDETAPNALTLVRAPHDPQGVLQASDGKPLGVSVIRRMAAGKRDPFAPGLVCGSCTAEFQWSRWELLLESFDAARDPYGVGAKYRGRHLPWSDWQRIASGHVPMDEDARLRDDACREVWTALGEGELAGASRASLPDWCAARPRERILLSFAAARYRSSARGWHADDRGRLCITTERVVFDGQRHTEVPHRTVSRCHVQTADHTEVVCVDAWDQFAPLYFTGPAEAIPVSVDGIGVLLPADAERVAGLIRARAGIHAGGA